MSPAARLVPILLFCISLRAGTPTGSLAGIVLDPSLAAVGGAAITATQSETGNRRVTTSGADGTFTLPFLPPGHWTIVVDATGFEPSRSSATRIAVDQTAWLVLNMNIAGEHSSANVNATYPANPGEIISRVSIADLPLNGRQYLDLARLAPGLVPAPAGTQGLGFNLAGSRSQSNVYLLDGISNQDTQNSTWFS